MDLQTGRFIIICALIFLSATNFMLFMWVICERELRLNPKNSNPVASIPPVVALFISIVFAAVVITAMIAATI